MKPQHKPQYNIIRTEKFIVKTNDFKKQYKRMLHLVQAIDWALVRRPHSFSNVIGDYYMLKTGELENPDFPNLKVLYFIEEENKNVILIDIED